LGLRQTEDNGQSVVADAAQRTAASVIRVFLAGEGLEE
jgi:hypothetical protein